MAAATETGPMWQGPREKRALVFENSLVVQEGFAGAQHAGF